MARLRPSLATFALTLTACAAESTPPAALPSSPPPPGVVASPPVAFTPIVTETGGAPPALSPSSLPPLPTEYLAAYRALLAQMLAVDTSHGDETKLLEPIAALYRDAGVPVQILESAPGRGNLIARLKGDGSKHPLLLLAHVDVVPVEGQAWTVPPFALTEKDGELYGRGVNDDKGMAAAIVALSLELTREHAHLTRDVIVALTAGEETGGSAGARWLAQNHKELIDAEVALNEGGDILVTDDLAKPISVSINVSEKVFQSYRLVVKGPGGHSSRPPTASDPVVTLARALLKVGAHRFPAQVSAEAKAAFAAEIPTAEPRYVAALKRAVASAPRLSPADDAVLSADAGYNALVRTTCVTTMLKGSPQDNVLPNAVEATVNCRVLPGETRASVHEALTKVVGDPNVSVAFGLDVGEGPSVPFDGEVVAAVQKVTEVSFPGVPVVPGMSLGASDSRHLRSVGIRAYGVTPVSSTRAEAQAGHIAHGADERRSARWATAGATFFKEVVRRLVL